MASGTLSALALICISLACIAYVTYRTRVENLTKREKSFDEHAHEKIFTDSRQTWKEGHIFGHLWHISDIRDKAQQMGYALDRFDILHIVGRIKENFDKRTGINEDIITAAITAYVESRIIHPPVAHTKDSGIYSFSGALNAIRNYASTKG